MTIHTRLKELRLAKNLSFEVVAAKIGVSWQTIQQWEKNTAPKRTRLQQVADYFGVTKEFLLTGSDAEDNGYSYIDSMDLKLSAGAGNIVVSHDVKRQIAFRTDFLKKEGIKAKDALGFPVDGSSMVDVHIIDGSTVVLNTSKREPKENKFFAIWIEDKYYIKKIVRENDKWIARSCNKKEAAKYPDIECASENSGIIGMAFWCGFKL